jgi:hypothetical protein
MVPISWLNRRTSDTRLRPPDERRDLHGIDIGIDRSSDGSDIDRSSDGIDRSSDSSDFAPR